MLKEAEVIEMEKEFIANASHELRTPITIIRGFAEILQDAPDLPEETKKTILAKIVQTCGRLEKLVKSLLTLSDAEQGAFHSCDLLALVKSCKENLLIAHPEAHVSIRGQQTILEADPDLLELAVMNLLENAVRYSREPAQIEISFYCEQGRIWLKVTDKGIGISEADCARIFDRFYTVDKTHSRKSGGAGLGLSIVKAIVEKHKGEYRVSSKVGKGSTFILIFPRFYPD